MDSCPKSALAEVRVPVGPGFVVGGGAVVVAGALVAGLVVGGAVVGGLVVTGALVGGLVAAVVGAGVVVEEVQLLIKIATRITMIIGSSINFFTFLLLPQIGSSNMTPI